MTINNYTPDDIKRFDALAANTVYSIRGFEVGDLGTPHIQGYMAFKSQRTFKSMRKAIPRASYRGAKGTALQNQTYCQKDDNFTETGTPPEQGKRNDIVSFVAAVAEAPSRMLEGELLTNHASMLCRYPNFVDRVMRHYHPAVRRELRENYWFLGESHCSKTWTAEQNWPDHFMKACDNSWHDGYTNQQVLIYEDLSPENVRHCGYLMKLACDYKPYPAPYKGGVMWIRPAIIVVTSQYTFEELWPGETGRKYREAIENRFYVQMFTVVHPAGPKVCRLGSGGLLLPPTSESFTSESNV